MITKQTYGQCNCSSLYNGSEYQYEGVNEKHEHIHSMSKLCEIRIFFECKNIHPGTIWMQQLSKGHKSQHQHLGPQPTSALPTICSMVSMRRLLVVRSPLFESQGGSAVRNEYEIHNGRAAGWKLWPISQTEIWQLLLFTCPEHRVGSINNQSYGILNVSMYIRFMFMYCISYSINFIYTAN